MNQNKPDAGNLSMTFVITTFLLIIFGSLGLQYKLDEFQEEKKKIAVAHNERLDVLYKTIGYWETCSQDYVNINAALETKDRIMICVICLESNHSAKSEICQKFGASK